MLVDHERVLLDLKREIAEKSHHGQRDLFALIGELEARHAIEEGLPEKAMRLYGLAFFEEAIKAPGSERERVPAADGAEDRPPGGDKVRALRGDSNHESEEDTNGRNGNPAAAASENGSVGAAVTSIVGRARALD